MTIEKFGGSIYSNLIENMPDGFVYMKCVYSDSGKANDYIFLETNRTFEQLIGLRGEALHGKRITKLSPDGRIAGIDFFEICGKAASLGTKVEFECYSNELKKWNRVYAYKCEEDCFCILLQDITEIKNRAEKINTLYQSAVRFNETPFLEIDYQWIADELLKLTGAAFVLANVFDKETMKTFTRGFSGFGNNASKVAQILGHSVIGKAWDTSESDLAAMKSKKMDRIGLLHEFNMNRIPPILVNLIEKMLKLGEAFGIGMTYKDEVLGSFLIMMREGDRIESPDIAELFVNQLGMMLLQKKTEAEVRKIDQQYRTVFSGSQDAMFLINVDHEKGFTYHMINEGYMLDVGINQEKVNGLTPRDLYGESVGKEIEDHYLDCIAAKKPVTYEETINVLGEKKVWHTLLSPIINEDNVVQIVGSSRNITKLKQWEDEISRERQLFKVTLHSIGDAVITTDIENRIVMLNKAAEVLTGWSQEDACGKLLGEVMTVIKEGHVDDNHYSDHKVLISRDGGKKIISSSEAFIKDECENVLGVVIVFRDVTLDKQKEEEVRYLGYNDKLTGLYNRTYFEEALERLDDERYLPLGLIMGDSNGLKMVNDAFGHEEGDKLLKSIADIFKSVCDKDDIVARVGGDEFAVILPSMSTEKENYVISRIKQMCNINTGELISPSVALGAAIKTRKNQDINAVYKLAEDRMYNNKLVESKSTRSSIISSLKKTLEERTHETEAHAQRMKELSTKVGKIMRLHDNEMDELSLLAMLHDIGKIAIPDYILEKPSGLSADEWKIMKNHCEIGYRIAVASPELAHIASLILSHHERWDGTGYPQGLKEEEIPLLSRIISVVDAYDAMTNDRPYHAGISSEEALTELVRCSGIQFDPGIVEKVVEVILSSNKGKEY